MIEKLPESTGSVIGYACSGTVTKADYQALTPELGALADQFGTVQVLWDLTGFRAEEPSAWASDLKFGRDFHHVITRMAFVGDGRIEGLLARLSAPFYAKQAKAFPDRDSAWAWLKG